MPLQTTSSSLQVFRLILCKHFSSPPCVQHTPPISFSSNNTGWKVCYYLSICLEELRKVTTNHSQYNPSSGLNSKLDPPEQEARVLTTTMQSSIVDPTLRAAHWIGRVPAHWELGVKLQISCCNTTSANLEAGQTLHGLHTFHSVFQAKPLTPWYCAMRRFTVSTKTYHWTLSWVRSMQLVLSKALSLSILSMG